MVVLLLVLGTLIIIIIIFLEILKRRNITAVIINNPAYVHELSSASSGSVFSSSQDLRVRVSVQRNDEQPAVPRNYEQPSVSSGPNAGLPMWMASTEHFTFFFINLALQTSGWQPAVPRNHEQPSIQRNDQQSAVTRNYEQPNDQQPAVSRNYEQPSIQRSNEQPAISRNYEQPNDQQPAIPRNYEKPNNQQPAVPRNYEQPSVQRNNEQHAISRNYEQPTTMREKFFAEERIYREPAKTTTELYEQLSLKKYREIPRRQIRILAKIGSGHFGEVFKAEWHDGEAPELAVKTLKSDASEVDKVKFLQEAAIMGQFSHPNVVKLYGVVTAGEPVIICLELMANGDLESYLHKNFRSPKLSSHEDNFMKAQETFLRFAREIAAGMEYLSGKSFIHRDLATRNVFLNDNLTCKIGDFGLARDLMDDDYYRSSGGKIPVKWTAPEAILYRKYSTDSDVWSYGMVLFEIWSLAKQPFPTLSNREAVELFKTGFCQAPPPGCPRAIYELMVECWNPDHEKRPSFKEIHSRHLQQSSTRLLYWSPKDNSLSPSVGVLGAPLQAAFKLHLDLQERYRTKSEQQY